MVATFGLAVETVQGAALNNGVKQLLFTGSIDAFTQCQVAQGYKDAAPHSNAAC